MEIDKIKTKYQIGDKVYFLHRNEIRNGTIYLIEVNLTIFNGGVIKDIYYKNYHASIFKIYCLHTIFFI